MKSIAKKSASVVHSTLAAVAGVTDPLPAEDAPSPPDGYAPPAKVGRAARPLRAQIELAPRVASELRGDASYAQRFGDGAPDPGTLAAALTLARAWSDKLRSANQWAQYVRDQERIAWKHAMGLANELKVPFEYHAGREPALNGELPSTAAFLRATSARSKQAHATRVKKEKEAKAAALPPKGSPPPSPPPSPTVTDPVKAAAVKLLN